MKKGQSQKKGLGVISYAMCSRVVVGDTTVGIIIYSRPDCCGLTLEEMNEFQRSF